MSATNGTCDRSTGIGIRGRKVIPFHDSASTDRSRDELGGQVKSTVAQPSVWLAGAFEHRASIESVPGVCVRPTPPQAKKADVAAHLPGCAATSAYSSTGPPTQPGCPSA